MTYIFLLARNGLDGLGMESWWGHDFLHPSRPALGPTQPPLQCVGVCFVGIMQHGRGIVHPLPSGTEVKERVELYLCSASGLSWSVVG